MEQEEIGKFRRALPQFIAVSIKNILLFVYGMTLGFPTIVIPSIQGGDGREPSDIVLSREEISWFSSINLICVPLGCLFSGLLTQPIGKRRAMQFVNLPILASWLLFHFANRTEHLYAALCFSGLGGGLMEAPVLTYVAEITEPEYRGILSALGSTCVITGVFIQFIMGSLMDWRTVAAVSSAFPVISIIALCFVPESPTWLIRERRFKEAVKALQWLRGWVPEHKIEPEFNRLYEDLITKPALEEAHENTDVRPSKLKSFFRMFRKRSFLAPFALVALTFFTGHFSGKTSLQTYAVQIFHTLKAPINKYHATILLGVAEMIATIMCVCLIHFTGKRPLVLVSTIGVSVCFFGTATYAHYLKVVPGFAVDNVVANASSIVPKQNIISQKNISDIFESQQKALLRTSQNSDLLKNGEYNDSEITTILPTDIIFETTGLNNILNRTSRETPIILAADGIRIDDNNTENYRNEDIIRDSQTNRNKFNYEIYNDTNTDNETDTYPDSTASEQMDELVPTTQIPAYNTTSGGSKKHQNFNSNPSSTEHDGIDLLLTVPQQEKNYLVWLPLVLLLGSAFFAHLGIRMIPWILIGEVFPAPVRSTASGLVSALGYIFGFLANKLFLQMLVVLTLPGTFWFYSAVAISGATILFFILPETEGRTLAEIEAHFSKKSSVNLLDKSSNAKKVQETSIQLENLQNLHIPRGSLSHPKALAVQPRDLNAKNGSEILGKDNAAFEGNHTTQM